MPFRSSFVNGFVQISAVYLFKICSKRIRNLIDACYVVMAQDFNSFPPWNTVFRNKIREESGYSANAGINALFLRKVTH